MSRLPPIAFLIVLPMSALLLGSDRSSGCESNLPFARPNIVLIVADDLGYGDLGCYGQKRIRTPCLDALAAAGRKFTDFYAGSPVCAPSRCVLMTGYHTGHALIRGNARQHLRTEDITLAKVIQAAGYATAMFGKWGLGDEGTVGRPRLQGFDDFFGYLDQGHAHNYYPSFLIRNENRVLLRNVVPDERANGAGVATARVEYSHDLLVDAALQWIDKHRAGNAKQPFFLYLPFTIPHANNEAAKQGMEVPDLDGYAQVDWPLPQRAHAAMIGRLDRDVGRVIERLKRNNCLAQTLVLFMSDNGPHAEGGNDPEFNDSNGPLRGMKRSLHEGGIRVPLIAYWPGTIQPGVSSDLICGSQDLLPTLAELAGERAVNALPQNLDGLSLISTLLSDSTKQRQHDYLYWEFYEGGGARAVRSGRWKAIEQPIGSRLRLYDLDKDLGEERDLAVRAPQVASRLQRLMSDAHSPSPRWEFPNSVMGSAK